VDEVAVGKQLGFEPVAVADEAFEAYLLEILSDFQVTIPELGTVRAPEPPVVISSARSSGRWMR
jgi:hypothetical protein